MTEALGAWRNARGVLWAMAGTFLFTFVFASGKLAGGEIPAIQILWLRYVSGFLVVLALVLRSPVGLAGHLSRRPHWHLGRAVFGSSGGICTIHAATLMPIADATAIGLTEGLISIVLAIVLLGERVVALHWVAAVLSAAGALLVVNGGFDGLQLSLGPGALFALAGALLIAVESVLIKVLSERERALSVLLHVNFFALVIWAGPALWLWQPISSAVVIGCLCLGPLAITAQFCWIRAFQCADMAIAAPINYSWIVFAAGLGYLIWGEVPTWATLLGSAMICLGGVLLARLPARSATVARTAKDRRVDA